MLELVTTRHNPLVDPSLHVWAWQIPVYLFLGGWVAGGMVLTGWLVRREDTAQKPGGVARLLPWIGLVLISLGMLALFLDLEHKLYVWRVYLAFEPTSPMSWGAWILIAVYPVLALTGIAALPPPLAEAFAPLGRLAARLRTPQVARVLGAASIAFGTGLGIYTGILLSSLGAHPLWASAALGPLFLASGLSTGAAFAHLIARDPAEQQLLMRADNAFLVTELALVGLILASLATSGAAAEQAAALLLGGPYTAAFWVLVVALGMVLPLAIQALGNAGRMQHTVLAPLLVMAGGLALRFVIVAAGQFSHWP